MQNTKFVMESTFKHICANIMHIRDMRHHVMSNLTDFGDFKKILQNDIRGESYPCNSMPLKISDRL